MKLKWNKSTPTYIEAYLGPWQVLTLIKEGGVWKWYNELPFSTTEYNGRQFGTCTTAKQAATEATRSVKEWLSEAELTQTTSS